MKIKIKNRKGKQIVLLMNKGLSRKRVIVIPNGMGSTKEDYCLKTISEFLNKKGHTIIRFDSTNNSGESEGDYEEFTITNHVEDLEDVINWGEKNKIINKKIILIGHSIGGMSAFLFSTKNPTKTIIALSPIISGKLYLDNYDKQTQKEWKEKGHLEWKEKNITKRIRWCAIEDSLKYDLLKETITTNTLLISSKEDKISPLLNQKKFYNKIKVKKRLKIIPKSNHNFQTKYNLNHILVSIESWIKE